MTLFSGAGGISIGVKSQGVPMGMTGDFEVGIEEGATEIRIGSALFEGIPEEP